MSLSPLSVTGADVRAAAEILRGYAIVTPLLESPLLNARLGGRLLLKAEPLQVAGSFKFRGAFARMSQIPAAERGRGVVAFSSGNHAQGVAAAAHALGIPATIVMPSDAPAVKITNTRAWGAETVLYDRARDSREALGAALAAERAATLVKPYDDYAVIAGQGTVGLEILQQTAAHDPRPTAVLVPCGGGGLVAGTAIAVRQHMPETAIWAVEPEGFDDTARALRAGHRLVNPPAPTPLCDALAAPEPGELTFPLNQALLAGGLVVSEASVRLAMATAFHSFKLVLEPGGAVALAAVLDGQFPLAGGTVVVVGSGGSVDPGLFARILAETPPL